MIQTQTLSANTSGQISEILNLASSVGWTISALSITSPTPQPISATMSFFVGGAIEGISYYPQSDVGTGSISLGAGQPFGVVGANLAPSSTFILSFDYTEVA